MSGTASCEGINPPVLPETVLRAGGVVAEGVVLHLFIAIIMRLNTFFGLLLRPILS